MDLVIATTNPHKVREIRSFLRGRLKLELYSLVDFPHYTQPAETGTTFRENAHLKATHAVKALQKWVLADDSGLVVPALQGEPGVYSARYAGPQATDKDNRKKLLEAMKNLDEGRRQAYLECSLVLLSPEGYEKSFSGIVEGTITQEERGGNGFGYDPLFLKYGYNLTLAELSNEELKNKISHRGKALQKLLVALEGI